MFAVEMLLLAARDAARGCKEARRWLRGDEPGRVSVKTCLEMVGINSEAVSYRDLERLARRYMCRREIIRTTRTDMAKP